MLLGALRSGRVGGKYLRNKSRVIGHTVTDGTTGRMAGTTAVRDLLVRRNFDLITVLESNDGVTTSG